MRHGLEIPCGGAALDLRTLIDLAVLAEASGWDGVWFEDYLVHYAGDDPPTFDPWVLLAAVAVRTVSIRLGTTVTSLPRRDPRKLAREATTLDHLSAGRVTLAVGAGDPNDRGARPAPSPRGEVTEERGPSSSPPSRGRVTDEPGRSTSLPSRGQVTEEPGRSSSPPSRGQVTDERLGELLALLSGEPVDGVTFRPSPVQRPRLPVWVGGSTQAGHAQRRAATANGIVPYKMTDTGEWSDFTPAEVEALVADLQARRSQPPALSAAPSRAEPTRASDPALRAAPSGTQPTRALDPALGAAPSAAEPTRPGPTPFDVALGGRRRRPDEAAERAYLADLEAAGATWWLEFIPPTTAEKMAAAIARGPLRP